MGQAASAHCTRQCISSQCRRADVVIGQHTGHGRAATHGPRGGGRLSLGRLCGQIGSWLRGLTGRLCGLWPTLVVSSSSSPLVRAPSLPARRAFLSGDRPDGGPVARLRMHRSTGTAACGPTATPAGVEPRRRSSRLSWHRYVNVGARLPVHDRPLPRADTAACCLAPSVPARRDAVLRTREIRRSPPPGAGSVPRRDW